MSTQVAVNRGRLGLVLERLLPDIERQKEATAREEEDIEFVKTYFAVSDIASPHHPDAWAYVIHCHF